MTGPRVPRVLVTGGTRGIGAAVARGCAARGWPVAAAAGALMEALAVQDARALALPGDVTQAHEVAQLFDRATEAFGGIESVVVNAGIAAPLMPLAQMDPARIEDVIRTNLTGALFVAREAARRLPDHAGASLVFVSSAAARLGSPGEYVDYAATKGAIDTLTLGLAKELGPRGIRVNAVRPGLIETDMHAATGAPDRAARIGAAMPLGRAGTPEEVAEAILWLISDAASYVSGAILDVAGGH